MNLLGGEDRADEDDHGSVLGVVGRLRKPPESPTWVAAAEKARGEREVEGCVWWGWGVVRLCWVLGGLSLASLPFFFF